MARVKEFKVLVGTDKDGNVFIDGAHGVMIYDLTKPHVREMTGGKCICYETAILIIHEMKRKRKRKGAYDPIYNIRNSETTTQRNNYKAFLKRSRHNAMLYAREFEKTGKITPHLEDK